MDNQDFVKGVDFTGINPATGADHNNLIELAIPKSDGADDKGKGLALITLDTALNTPDVPDAATTIKWQRYPWFRKMFNGATSPPKCYIWDNNAVNDATYKKWIEVETDLTTINAQIASVTATADDAVIIANNAGDVAANATVQVATATAIANAATVTANQAEADLATANLNITTVTNQATVNAAAIATITAQIAGPFMFGSFVSVGAGSKIRVNTLNNDFTSYLDNDNVFTAIEIQVNNVGAGAAVIGSNLRALNSSLNTSFATLTGSSVYILVDGIYYIEAAAIVYNSAGSRLHISHLGNILDVNGGANPFAPNVVPNLGSLSMGGTAQPFNAPCLLSGIITIKNIVGFYSIDLNHYFKANTANGLGLPANCGDALNECYSYIKITKLV